MGGKHKQAQRTKNNARPSSSGRSAELLGSSINSFVGFQTVKDSTPVLPGFGISPNSNDDVEMNIDTNFQLVLKKMNKKDSKTKLKALQEFTELVKSSQAEAVKAVLPFWPRFYSILAVDVDHKVREATHNAHRAVVMKVKRNLAPHLKQLAGPWFTSQYDTYAPAATAATQSFEDAFPPNKLQEAIAFCQEEILSYIFDSIVVQTPETLTNGKTISHEEAEAKYERLLISSLQGYVLYLNKLSKEQVQSAEELNTKIISNGKFWKLSKSKVPLIRAAFYGCVTALCKNSPFLLINELNRVTAAVFSNLDDAEPNVLNAIWQAALFIISNIPKWWKYVNIEKLVLPKLWKILREGGQGTAASIFPNLLPLISHLPVTVDHSSLYENFFQNIITGMQKRQVIQSRVEFGAIATTFVECFRYVIMRNASDVPTTFGESLIISYLVPTIEWCFLEQNIPVKVLFNEISILIHCWERNKNSTEFENYVQFLACFWKLLKESIRKTLTSSYQSYEKDSMLLVSNKQVEFVICLKRGGVHKLKKFTKVKFSSTEHKTELEDAPEDAQITDCKGVHSTELNDIAYNTCFLYLKFIQEKRKIELISSLCLLVQHFDSADLFHYLNIHLNNTDNDKLISLHESVLLFFLKIDLPFSESVVDLVFVLYKHLQNDEKKKFLDSLTKLTNEDCFCCCVAKALSHPYCNDSTIKTWLSTASITKVLVNIASTMLTDEISSEKSLLLKQSLNQTVNGDLFISEEACKEIISILCNTLLSPCDYPNTIDLCASFTAQLAATLYTEKTLLTYGDQLILALFSLSCNTNYNCETLSKDTAWEVNTAWQDAVTLLLSENLITEFEHLSLKFREIIHTEFMNDSSKQTVTRLTMVFMSLLKSIAHNDSNYDRVYQVIKLILTLPTDIQQMEQKLSDICASALLIRGYVTWIRECPLPENIFDIHQTDAYILKYMHWCRFVINALSELLQQSAHEENEEHHSNQLPISFHDYIYDFVVAALHSFALVKIFTDYFKTAKLYGEIIEIFGDVTQEYKDFLTTLVPDDIIKKLENNSTKTLYIFYADSLVDKNKMKDIYTKLVRQNNSSVNDSQLTQIFAKHLTFDHVYETNSKLDRIIVTRALIHCDEIDVQIAEAINGIMFIREKEIDSLLYNKDISTCNWMEIQTVVEIIRFLTAVIDKLPMKLSSQHWDFVIISLTSWAASAEKSKHNYGQIAVLQFICATCEFYVAFHKFIKNDQIISNLNYSCSNFIAEFCDIFAQDVHISLINIWIYIAEQELEIKNTSITKLSALDIIGNVILHLEAKYIIKVGDLKLPKWQTIVQLCGKLLQSRVNVLQLWGYHGIHQILSELVLLDIKSDQSSSVDESYGIVASQLGHVLTTMQDVVQTMLMDFKIGEDSCRVQSFTDSYTFTFGYLLVWDILLTFCQSASAALRYQYSEWLRDREYLKNLLNNIFKLMPTEVLHCAEGKKSGLTELFTVKPLFTFSISATSEYLEHTVCWLYGRILTTLPALARQWWTDTEQKSGQIVEMVTAAYISPMVCAQELQDVADKDRNTNNNMKVKVHPSAREVVATYTVDEARMELMITLPLNYPLGAVQVSCTKEIGGTSLCRNWVMQLTIFLTHQNGRIWDALSVWKSSLDKKFDGVEECYICFSVLHHTTCQLPKLSCQTCRKKFHTTCLYKWFSTSNKSTCPICRNLF